MVVSQVEILIWPYHHRQIRSFFCPGNVARAFDQAVECIDSGTTFTRQIHYQHAASDLTDMQHRALFSGEGLV